MFSVKLDIPIVTQEALKTLSKREKTRLLGQIGRRAVTEGKVLQKHYDEGQSAWPEQDPAYVAQKQKKHGHGDKFCKTGTAAANLTKVGKHVKVRPSGKKGRVTIALHKTVEGGRNAYSIAQRGRFKGTKVRTATGQEYDLTAQETQDRNAMLHEDFKAHKAKGGKGNFRQFLKRRGDVTKRLSDGEMLISAPLNGDEDIIIPLIEQELMITLKKRGFYG